MRAIDKKTGKAIAGTLETVQGVANIIGNTFVRDKDGLDFEYAGDTDIWWDEQMTVKRGNHRIFVTEDGYEVLESDIELVETDEEADE